MIRISHAETILHLAPPPGQRQRRRRHNSAAALRWPRGVAQLSGRCPCPALRSSRAAASSSGSCFAAASSSASCFFSSAFPPPASRCNSIISPGFVPPAGGSVSHSKRSPRSHRSSPDTHMYLTVGHSSVTSILLAQVCPVTRPHPPTLRSLPARTSSTIMQTRL
jgi:hypothetical protein